jgi:hypothetical protein
MTDGSGNLVIAGFGQGLRIGSPSGAAEGAPPGLRGASAPRLLAVDCLA